MGLGLVANPNPDQLCDYLVFTAFGVTMNGYHAHLVLHNLTTNEHINKSRYHYLKVRVRVRARVRARARARVRVRARIRVTLTRTRMTWPLPSAWPYP